MSLTIGGSLLSHLTSGGTSLAWGLKMTRRDAAVYGFTSFQRDIEIGGVEYLAGPGLDVQSLVSSAGFAVDNTELTILADDAIITRADILAGRWNYATFELFQFNWSDTNQGRIVPMVGTLGEVTPQRGAYKVELRGLQQYPQQPVGAVSTKTCRARLGDARCRKVLTSFTHSGTVSAVTSNQVFVDNARTEADHYFAEGELTWLTGDNAGITCKVKTYASATDTFTLAVPMTFPIQVGDTFSAIAGCRKRLDEDCRLKFDNVLNFQGEPHRPTVDDMTESPEPNAE